MIRIPIINLNGTDGTVLHQEFKDATNAVCDAITRMTEVTVHGRDFPNGVTALGEALAQHRERIRNLRNIHAELIVITLNLENQLAERERMRRVS